MLHNGPEMAACFIACASGVTSAPLNPAYRADEFEFYLSDLNAKALIVEAGSTSPAVAVAQKLGVRLIDLVAPVDGPRGRLHAGARATLPRPHAAAHGGYAEPDDVSLVLHTSGTTSRPKIVPLSQAQPGGLGHATSRRTLRFTPADRGLNIMPLFHIHGLIAGVLAPLSAGSFVFCTPGFNALKFFALDGRGPAHLVHGGADHAPGDPVARRQERRRHRAPPAALHPLVVVVAAAAGDRRARSGLRRAADREPTA